MACAISFLVNGGQGILVLKVSGGLGAFGISGGGGKNTLLSAAIFPSNVVLPSMVGVTFCYAAPWPLALVIFTRRQRPLGPSPQAFVNVSCYASVRDFFTMPAFWFRAFRYASQAAGPLCVFLTAWTCLLSLVTSLHFVLQAGEKPGL